MSNLQTVSGALFIRAEANLSTLQKVGGSLYIRADADLSTLKTVGDSLRISAAVQFSPDFKAVKLADDGNYQLWIVDEEFRAGCRKFLNAEDALAHWDREDERAELFSEAIKNFVDSKSYV